jgi:hypothetical protein
MKIVFRYKGGEGSGHYGHAGRQGKVGGSIPSNPEYHQDNPATRPGAGQNELDWVKNNPNSMTAYYKKLYLDPRRLEYIPGKKREHLHINQARVDELAKSMREHGYLSEQYAPLICVEADGIAMVWEGNHRIRAAIEAGLDRIPVDIRYYGGGEMVEGSLLEPKRVDRLAK